MFTVSKDTPCFYLTSVTKDRLPVFRKDEICEITCKAIDNARTSGNFLIFAYVIMHDHLHIITSNDKESKIILQFINGNISRHVIDYLKERGYESSLAK